MKFFHFLPASIITITTFILLMLSLEMGFRWGKRLKIEGQVSHTLLALLAAVLGLLGLLLGFSFSMSASRFETRKELLAKEADAMHTTYLRGDLLEEPRKSQFKSLTRNSVDSRVRYFLKNSL